MEKPSRGLHWLLRGIWYMSKEPVHVQPNSTRTDKKRPYGAGALSLRKDGRWEGKLYIGGKRRSVYGKTKDEASKRLAELIALRDQQAPMEALSTTVEQLMERYIASRENVLEDTRYKYRLEVKPLMELLGKMFLSDLEASHVRRAYAKLDQAGVAVRTQERVAMHLRAALAFAVEEEVLERNVAEAVKVSRPPVEPALTVWTPGEVQSFLSKANGDALYPLFYVFLTLGLKTGEALGLTWRSINFEAGTISITHTLKRTVKGSNIGLSEIDTGGAKRTLTVPEDTLAVLDAHRAQHGGLPPNPSGKAEEDFVFATSTGTPISPRNLRRSLNRLIAKAQVTPISVHALRDTYALLALAAGMPIEVLSRRLGHATVTHTLNMYCHAYQPGPDAEAALPLNDLLSSPG